MASALGEKAIRNIRNTTIVNMLPNRDKKTVTNHHPPGKEEVQYVAMDMWMSYRDVCQAAISDARTRRRQAVPSNTAQSG